MTASSSRLMLSRFDVFERRWDLGDFGDLGEEATDSTLSGTSISTSTLVLFVDSFFSSSLSRGGLGGRAACAISSVFGAFLSGVDSVDSDAVSCFGDESVLFVRERTSGVSMVLSTASSKVSCVA